MDDAIRRVIDGWRASGVPLQAGLAPADIEVSFAKVGRQLSFDIVTLYSLCNGMPDAVSDNEHFFSLWSVEKCIREAPRFARSFIPFADFLISSHEYCFRFQSPERSSVHVSWNSVDGRNEQVAASVEEFFWLLANQPVKVYTLLRA